MPWATLPVDLQPGHHCTSLPGNHREGPHHRRGRGTTSDCGRRGHISWHRARSCAAGPFRWRWSAPPAFLRAASISATGMAKACSSSRSSGQRSASLSLKAAAPAASKRLLARLGVADDAEIVAVAVDESASCDITVGLTRGGLAMREDFVLQAAPWRARRRRPAGHGWCRDGRGRRTCRSSARPDARPSSRGARHR